MFASYEGLCRVLTRKATYGKRLHKAYQQKDMEALRALVEEIRIIKEDMQEFLNIYRYQWRKENKGYGLEVIDLRVGGLIARVDSVVSELNNYIDGTIERIYELEEETTEYWNDRLSGDESYAVVHSLWGTIYTVNIAY